MSSPNKKPCTAAPTTKTKSFVRIPEIWAVLLRMCDEESVFGLALIVYSDPSLRDLAKDEEMWSELMLEHFEQKRKFGATASCPASTGVPDFYANKSFQPCASFVEFCETVGEKQLFDRLRILQGDIGQIAEIDSKPLDCLIFPTNYSLRNAGAGAANAIFQRAGPQLDQHVLELNFNGHPSDAVTTPGFNSGVDHLVHCIGPSPHQLGGYPLLYQTYINAFAQARRHNAKCIAVASIATGSLGFPLHAATTLAVRAFRDFVKSHRWEVDLAFVCWDGSIAQAMRSAKSDTLERFNDGCFQVVTV